MTINDIPIYDQQRDRVNGYNVNDIVRSAEFYDGHIWYYKVWSLGKGYTDGTYKAMWGPVLEEEVEEVLKLLNNGYINIF